MRGSLQLPASALTFFWDDKLPTGCSLSVLHYRPNAASPVPTALRSFSAFLPCSSSHLTQDSPFPVKRHIVPSHLWDIDWSKVRVCAAMLHGSLGVIAWPKSHGEFKGSPSEALVYFSRRQFSLMLAWCPKMCTHLGDFFLPINTKSCEHSHMKW